MRRATSRPIAFRGTEFIRIGSSTRKLRDHPAAERELWRSFLDSVFEDGIAAEHLTGQDILQTLDYPTYFHLLRVPPADGRDAILKALAHDQLIKSNQAGGYDVTNLGAIRERLHACYMHACLRHVTQQPMTNSSVRARFKIADKNASIASRLLADPVDEELIVVADPAAGPRLRRYLPFWAQR